MEKDINEDYAEGEMKEKILTKLVDIVLILVMACLAWYLITGLTTGKPNVLGYRIFYVPTESMVPAINPGDFVVGIPVNHEDVKVGDIVTYKSQSRGTTICHRVIGKTEEGLVFKGDKNVDADMELVRDDAVGYKIVKIFRFW